MGSKRRNFSAEEDLALLCQALSERPFLKERGKTMAAWDELAAQHVGDDYFSRDKLSGKNAQARVDKLVQQKRQPNAVASAASAVQSSSVYTTIQRSQMGAENG